MKGVLLAALMISAAVAWIASRRRPDTGAGAIAALLAIGAAGDATLWALDAAAIAPLRAELGTEIPWTGWPRILGHAADAIWLAWPAAVAGASLLIFARRSAAPATAGWAVAAVGLAVVHPIGCALGWSLLAAQGLAAIASIALCTARWRERSRPISPGETALTVLVAHEVVSVIAGIWLGPYARSGALGASAVLVLCAVTALTWRSSWTTSPSSSP